MVSVVLPNGHAQTELKATSKRFSLLDFYSVGFGFIPVSSGLLGTILYQKPGMPSISRRPDFESDETRTALTPGSRPPGPIIHRPLKW
jgi:hypothetical protein